MGQHYEVTIGVHKQHTDIALNVIIMALLGLVGSVSGLSGESGHGASGLVSQCGSTIKSPSVRTVTSRYPS